jgi:hypothetical protein
MTMGLRVLFALLLVLNACTTPTEPSGQPFWIRIGETKAAGSLRIRFADVADSRCAPNVVCVWEGDAAVTLEVDGQRVVVHTHGSAALPRTAIVRGHEITLEDVQPVSGSSKSEYRARIVIR